jgi:hypothetical protein
MMGELDYKLEEAFGRLKENIENALIIVHLQSDDKEVNIYLIAKQPNEDIYYGILETEFITKKQIAGIPLSNIIAADVKEVSVKPFWSKTYIEENIKKFKPLTIRELFLSNKDFREKIIFLHQKKSKDYLATKAQDLLFALDFSKGMDSIPICISTTKSVKSYSINNLNEITYNFNSGFLGVPKYLNIVELFPLLSEYCYLSKNNDELLNRMLESKNGQLLAFRESLIKKASTTKLNELVLLLNQPESNSEIKDIDGDVNKDIIVLNRMAYESIFKALITDEILEEHNHSFNKSKNSSIDIIDATIHIKENKEIEENNIDYSNIWMQKICDTLNETTVEVPKEKGGGKWQPDKFANVVDFIQGSLTRNKGIYDYLNERGLINTGYCPVTGDKINNDVHYKIFGRIVYLSEKGKEIAKEFDRKEHIRLFGKEPMSSERKAELRDEIIQKQGNKIISRLVIVAILLFILFKACS